MIDAKDLPTPDDLRPIRRALLSVFDKTDLVPFAERLLAHGVELISSGGTARTLREAGLPVTDVQDVTGVPEILGGRVKTLHPAIHGGLLARRTDPDDLGDLDEHGFPAIDLVVTSLYPFEEVAGREEVTEAEALENIDIGGPAMVRAAAKNFYFVGVVTARAQYDAVADALDAHDGQLPMNLRRRLAHRAFERTAAYDRAITDYFAGQATEADEADDDFPSSLNIHAPQVQTLRYGENPHQRAALYGTPETYFRKLHGKALSYNNLIDLSAALALIDEFREAPPTCAILKHTNPCGVATAETLELAYQNAFATDRQSPFGGIVVVNRSLDRATAEAIDAIFTELIIAPAYDDGVLELLMQKKNRRLIEHRAPARQDEAADVRTIIGGVLVQDRDPVLPPAAELRSACSVVTQRGPTEAEWHDLDFAWRVCKHVKSNAIVYARDRATLGIGAGQMSRVDASELAVAKGAKSELDFTGSVVASDAFFPFADGLVAAADSGARAAIQPGGSIRDDEVIEAADAHDVAMVFTGQRHFRH
ncbi:MAG: bifunctional phosphoribosylaminoimidazolecarboxamide formyltransferase/IMP cyclohydrolase [Bacteroidetes bacterium]|jgi:phosphoribosylaminoimidazolecarboxamide formyltransferase/IMP cyclohydrolase|nr:bifunctional phosphoribosylaminoimidazolecarboxamide formyltransferase/IMP cyclohydrolase [Bacteroidota bacterium]